MLKANGANPVWADKPCLGVPSSGFSGPLTPPPALSSCPWLSGRTQGAEPQTANADEIHFLMVIPVGAELPREKHCAPFQRDGCVLLRLSLSPGQNVWTVVRFNAKKATLIVLASTLKVQWLFSKACF